jgi:GNAT superfamily N-acetyltransferase
VSAFAIRPARAGDEETIRALLYELAEYEKLTDKFTITNEIVTRDYLNARPLIQCELALEGEAPIGIATWYFTYSSFAAKRGIYLEDLFVRPQFRGRGYGKALLAHVAARACEHGTDRVDWAVLTWNAPAIAFYESLGARAVSDWHIYRLTGDALAKMCKP